SLPARRFVNPRTADLVVVGGGLVGCAVARALALPGCSVIVAGRGPRGRGGRGAGASSAAPVFLPPKADFASDGPLMRLGIASRDLYPRWTRAVARESGVDPHLHPHTGRAH